MINNRNLSLMASYLITDRQIYSYPVSFFLRGTKYYMFATP